MLPIWAWILIAIGAAGVFVFVLWLSWGSFCSRKPIRSVSFEAGVFEAEKKRAEMALTDLRRANREGIQLFPNHPPQPPGQLYSAYIAGAAAHPNLAQGQYACETGQVICPGTVETSIRMARTVEEIPQSPAPVAPPGFITLPMVMEKRVT